MRIDRGAFLQCLESVQPGLVAKVTVDGIEQGTCFTFRRGYVQTFNEEVSCRMPTGLPKDFQCAVEAKPVLEMLRKLTEEEIDIAIEEDKLIISGRRRKARFVIENDIHLPVEHVEKAEDWKKLPADFGEAINIVRHCTGKNETYLYVNCIHIHPKWLEAEDTVQLCRWEMSTGISKPTLVRADAIKAVGTLGMQEFSETDGWLHFRNKDLQGKPMLVYSCRRYLEEFPDRSKHLNLDGKKVAFPKGLIEELDKANVFSAENDSDRVLVEMKPGKVLIIGQGPHGEYRAWPKMKYDGEPMKFLVVPDMLAEIVKEHNHCYVSADKLKVDGHGKYKYVACLARVEENEPDEPNDERNGDA